MLNVIKVCNYLTIIELDIHISCVFISLVYNVFVVFVDWFVRFYMI
jgi:hypothetical protein